MIANGTASYLVLLAMLTLGVVLGRWYERRLSTPTFGVPTRAWRAAVEVCRFAVEQLHPATVRRWPHQALQAVSDELMRSSEVFERELGSDLQAFAREAEVYERQRAPIRGTPPGPPAGPEDLGPQTDEARSVHDRQRKMLDRHGSNS